MTSTIALVEQQLSRLEKPRDEDFLDSSDAPAEDELARRLKAVAEAVGEESAAER